MYDLIPINYENESPTISGRDLHAALGVITDYPRCFSRMCEYGFDKGKSYRTILSDRFDGLPGKPRTDHVVKYFAFNYKEVASLEKTQSNTN